MGDDPPVAPRLVDAGDQCLIVEFGDMISLDTNRRALAFARHLTLAKVAGVTDIVPSHVGVGIHYRAEAIETTAEGLPHERIARIVRALLLDALDEHLDDAREIEIPVCMGGAHGDDLEQTAAALDLEPDVFTSLLVAQPLRVLMIGFAPGQPYLGLLDERLTIPRRKTPRTRVPAGSVAIANRQVTIYPFELPGGWHLVGRTPLALFDPAREAPCLLRPGDSVRFVPVAPDAFDEIAGS